MASADDHQFLHLADTCLRDLQQQLDTFDPDEMEADLATGVLRIAFPDRRNCILNRQAAAHQLWLAEGATAWHFAYSAERNEWLDTKGRGELREILEQVLSRRLGRSIQLRRS